MKLLTFEPDVDSLKLNQQAVHLGQRSFSSKVIVQTQRERETLKGATA